MSVREFFYNLPGTWKFTRDISSLKTIITGNASFMAKSDNLLYYHESGLNDQKIEFFRKYYYLFDPNSNKIKIFFDKNLESLFCTIYEVSKSSNYSEHICNQDIYKYGILAMRENEFSSKCLVKGPTKGFSIITNYKKHL